MTQYSVGKLLPNLNVTSDKSNSNDEECNGTSSKDVRSTTVRPNVQPLVQNPKVYKNKDGGFPTGIDLFSEENKELLSKRAQRFGIFYDKSKPTIHSLYESLGITKENQLLGKLKHVRLDTIHIRGDLLDFDTDDIMKYFQAYGPVQIEWICDYSCNVTFLDNVSSARALLGLSKSFSPSFYEKIKNSIQSSRLAKNSPKDSDQIESDSSIESIKIPVPPGNWRLGVKFKDANTILLRFATSGDKKLPGAEGRSKFYQKYGNPNYQGLTGIISNSRKLKQLSEASKRIVSESKKTASAFSNLAAVSSSSTGGLQLKHKRSMESTEKGEPKKIRPFMYADEEELKLKKNKMENITEKMTKGVHSRLGKKYTYQELCHVVGSSSEISGDSAVEVQTYGSSKNSVADLREKLSRRKKNYADNRKNFPKKHHNRYEKNDEESYESRRNKVFKEKTSKYNRIKESKESYYKRKHRSPLIKDSEKDESKESYYKRKHRSPLIEDSEKDEAKESYYKRKHRSPLIQDSEKDEAKESYYKRKHRSPLIEDSEKDEAKKSYYKRKHRSPLIEDSDDEDSESYSSP